MRRHMFNALFANRFGRLAALSGVVLACALLAVSLRAPTPLSAPPAAAQSAADTGYTEAEREALRSEVRAFLLEHPEILEEMARELENRRRVEAARITEGALLANSAEIYADGFSYVGGNPEGDVTLVEFLDYNCGFCKRAHGEVATLLENDPNIRYVIKEFPILGPESEFAGRAALAALKQDDGSRYFQFHDAMMSHRGRLSETLVRSMAADAGLDWTALEQDMASAEISTQIERTYTLAQTLQINGTPAFIVASSDGAGDFGLGEVVRGYVPAARLAELADAARAGR